MKLHHMTTLDNNRLVRAFDSYRAAGKKALLPFLTAGYPDLAATTALLRELHRRGVRVCELGFPFSDPVADGPVIQASYTAALDSGVTVAKIFAAVREYRRTAQANKSSANRQGQDELAILAMVSYSIVYRHGVKQFFADAAAAGFDGLIIPDLPLEEATAVEPLAASEGLCNVMLIAPTSPPKRRLEIARHSRGFIYYISVAGITGERTKLPPETIQAVADLRRHSDTPVCVGFGISSPDLVKTVCRTADGAIVGSAIVHRMTNAVTRGESRDHLVRHVGRFVGELMAPIR